MDRQAVSVEEPGRDPSLVPGNLTCDGGRVVRGTEPLCLFKLGHQMEPHPLHWSRLVWQFED